MPTYDYECTRCGEKFELFQSIKARAKKTIPVDCKDCKGKAPVVRCIGTGGGLIFKGSGFYITDYRSDGYQKAAKADSGDAKPAADAKPDAVPSGDKAAKSAGASSKPEAAPSKPAPSDSSGTGRKAGRKSSKS